MTTKIANSQRIQSFNPTIRGRSIKKLFIATISWTIKKIILPLFFKAVAFRNFLNSYFNQFNMWVKLLPMPSVMQLNGYFQIHFFWIFS